MNISNPWDEELFKEKHVKCEPKLYRQMFNEIWGCPHFFTAFLQATDMAVKVEYAKKIFAYYQSTNDVILPNTLYYRVVVFKAPLQGLCYTVRDAVDWFCSPTARRFM